MLTHQLAQWRRALEERLAPSRWTSEMPKLASRDTGPKAIESNTISEESRSASTRRRPPGGVFPKWKRALDLVLVCLALPVWLPLMILIMLLIKISSPGPAFYRQERVGLRRRKFMLYKFRSMHVNSETTSHESYFKGLMSSDAPMAKLDLADDRIIRGGHALRSLGLDELPQIFNIIRGEMSLVGPRPCTVGEFDHYLPWQKERVQAVPGLTGYWQVNGKNKTTFNEMIAMDIFYAEHASLRLDLLILIKTIPVLWEQTIAITKRRARRMAAARAHRNERGRVPNLLSQQGEKL